MLLPISARIALPRYLPLVAARYVELVRWLDQLQRNTKSAAMQQVASMTSLMDVSSHCGTALRMKLAPPSRPLLTKSSAQPVPSIDCARNTAPSESLMIMFNSVTDPEQFNAAEFRRAEPNVLTSTTASAAGEHLWSCHYYSERW